MKKIIATILSLSVLGASASASYAGPHDRQDNRKHHHRVEKVEKKKSDKDAIAAGILGLAAGAIIAGAVNKPVATPVYPVKPHHPPKKPHYAPSHNKKPSHQTRHYNSKQWGAPFSPEWYRYCGSKFRSFNPKTGTYRTHSGKVQFCEMPEHERRGRR